MSKASPLNKVQRLALAADVAPRLRTDVERLRRRPVFLYNQHSEAKETTGTTTGDVAVMGLLATAKIELDVTEGVRPERVPCRNCGRLITVYGKGGVIPKLCQDGCDKECDICQGPVTIGGACKAARKGRRARCAACARKIAGARLAASLTSEERSALAKKRLSKLTDEQRKAIGARLQATLTPEHKAAGQRALAAMTAEQKAKQKRGVQAYQAAITPEERAKRARKAWATKRARKARSRTVSEGAA